MSHTQTTETDRKNWKVGSLLQVHIASRNKWYSANVRAIENDSDGEWLIVSIQDKILFELSRFDDNLRRHKTKEEIENELKEKQRIEREKEEKEEEERLQKEKEKLLRILHRKSQLNDLYTQPEVAASSASSTESDSDLSTDYYTESDDDVSSSSSSSNISMDSLDSIHSDDELAADLYANEENEDPALIVVVIERAGTQCINGKYIYKGEQRGKALWQKEDDPKAKLYWKYDNIWTLEYDNNDFYIAYTKRKLPPSSGWETVDKAEYPSPSVVLHRLNQMETIKNYVTGSGAGAKKDKDNNDTAWSPLEMMEVDFEIGDDLSKNMEDMFGFELVLNDITGLLVVQRVIEDSQASEQGLKCGDIMSNIEDDDISLIGSIQKLDKYLINTMKQLKEDDNSFITMNFGRKKSTFPIVLLSRSGVPVLNGKYSIGGRLNNTWRYVNNEDPKYEISRIYFDEDEDEAVWVVRTENKDLLLAQKEEEQRLLEEKQNEEENKRREEEERRVKEQLAEEERKKKLVDERWLFPLFKDAQLSDITGSEDSSKCDKNTFVEHYIHKKKVKIEIVERIWYSIDTKRKAFITLRQFFRFKTNFTMEGMRKLLPEFCPTPEHILKSKKAAAQRKKNAEQKKKQKEAEKKRKTEEAQKKKKAEEAQKKKKAVKIEIKKPVYNIATSEDELKKLGYKQLKEMCKQHSLPPNGTRTQLFIKLKKKLFPAGPKKVPQSPAMTVIVSTAADQISTKQKKKGLQPSPLPIIKKPWTPITPIANIDTPTMSTTLPAPTIMMGGGSFVINADVEHKEIVEYSDSESLGSDEESSSEESDEDKQANKYKDFYCGMTGWQDDIPPNYGWEAVKPNGIWPAPGLTVFDIELIKQNLQSPIIEKAVPSPGCATIHFMCDEPRVPPVCKHMKCWFEIEALGEDRVVKCSKSPAVFTNLVNGNNYQFIVKLCSDLSTKYSEKSEIITPLLLPNKPHFTNIEGKPKELFLYWNCKNYDASDVKAIVTLIITPIIAAPDGYKANENGEIILNSNPNDQNMIHLTGLKTGTDYEIQLRSTNTVGSMESEPEIATPAYPPPQPKIRKVIGGNREIIIDLDCVGWNAKETKCWFEVDVNPEEPTLAFLQQQIYKTKKRAKKQENLITPFQGMGRAGGFKRKSIMMMNRLQSARSHAGFSVVLSKIDLSTINDETKTEHNENAMPSFGFDESDEILDIPAYKRAKRYTSLPIIISPLVNGEEYVVTVRARNYTEIKASNTSDFISPKGVPPKPVIKSVHSRDSEVKILFECDDYSTLEYRAIYEVVSMPKTTKTKTRRFDMKFRNLDNGDPYSFRIRGVNSVGKGPWSSPSELIKPFKLPLNIQELRMVPGNSEISLYWVSDDVNKKKYDGWYEITTKPVSYTLITRRQQCTFKELMNECEYKFRIYAVNIIGRSNKHETHQIKPKSNVKQKLYHTLKAKTAQNIEELRQNYYQKIAEKDKQKNKELGGKKREKGKIINVQQQFEKGKKETDTKGIKTKKKGKKKKKKEKKKKKKKGMDLSGFASMVQKQQNKENKKEAKQSKLNDMSQARAHVLSRTKRSSIMDVTRIDNFSHKFKMIKK